MVTSGRSDLTGRRFHSEVIERMAGTGSKDDNNPPNSTDRKLSAAEQARRQQMLKVLRASEARHKEKTQRDAAIGMGDHVVDTEWPAVTRHGTHSGPGLH